MNAGHNAPMLLRASGKIERLKASGPPLGAVPGAAYREATTGLVSGDILVVFTDGVTEAVDDAEKEFGEARLEDLLRDDEGGHGSAASTCDRIIAAVREFEAGAPQNDDITLVVAKAR